MKITINDKTIELKYSFRALMTYEQVLNKSFEPKGVTEIITFMYCIITTSDRETQITYDEFLDWLDENPGLMKEFSDWLAGAVNRNAQLMNKETVKEAQKKTPKSKSKN